MAIDFNTQRGAVQLDMPTCNSDSNMCMATFGITKPNELQPYIAG